MKHLRLLSYGLLAVVSLTGCGKAEPDPVAAILAKKPAFLRIHNLSDSTFAVKLNGTAFGPQFAPGTSTAMTRVPNRTAQVELTPGGKLPSSIEVPAEGGVGTTLYVIDPRQSAGFILVAGDLYEPPKGESRIRAVSLGGESAFKVLRDGALWFEGRNVPAGGEAASAEVGKETTFSLAGPDGKTVAEAKLTPEPDRSYTILAHSVKGKPVLEVLVNNPPLSPRGPQGMMGSS